MTKRETVYGVDPGYVDRRRVKAEAWAELVRRHDTLDQIENWCRLARTLPLGDATARAWREVASNITMLAQRAQYDSAPALRVEKGRLARRRR